MKKIFWLLIWGCLLTVPLAADRSDGPVDEVRLLSSSVSAYYLPSLITSFGTSDSILPLHDNFGFSGSVSNLIPRGWQNLNFHYGASHGISDAPLMPLAFASIEEYLQIPQVSDELFLELDFSFLKYFKFVSGVQYLQNRVVEQVVNSSSAQYNLDYNYNNLAVNGQFIYDTRYSSLETWTPGRVFMFPEEGFMAALGGTVNNIRETETLQKYISFEISGTLQSYFKLHPYWVLALDLSGRSILGEATHRSALPTSRVLGTFDIPGDYVADLNAEIRFLYPGGLFVTTPAFIIAPFLFKFSPGMVAGYNGGIAGQYAGGDYQLSHSGYLAPLIAIRMGGGLMVILRMDFALGSDPSGRAVFSISYSTLGAETSYFFRNKL